MTTVHLTVRVPWHATGWSGKACAAPSANETCHVLPRIRQERSDSLQDKLAGRDWADLPESRLPPCVRERAGFMRGAEFHTGIVHPYTGLGSQAHDRLKPLNLRFPAYSAPCVPFRRMRRDKAEKNSDQLGVSFVFVFV